jgi:tRNA threonylcarbamoyladenosine biosynthesis protein TsaB
MSFILNIDTSSINCSVAISKNDQLLALVEKAEANIHASQITLFIEEACKKAKIRINELNAVAVSKGPGSYTGLRIGVSTAKGICYALSIPLIAVDTLKSLTRAAIEIQNNNDSIYIPMIDARRMEVYTKVFDHKLNVLQETEALILDEQTFSKFFQYKKKIILFGDGAEKTKSLIDSRDVQYLDLQHPSSKNMTQEAFELFNNKQFEDTAYFEPYYLKEFYFKK